MNSRRRFVIRLRFLWTVHIDVEIYYAYYYNADPDFDSEDLNKPLYQATIGTVTYRDGTTYYNIDFTSGSREGYYVVVIASDASIAEPYIVAYARIKWMRKFHK